MTKEDILKRAKEIVEYYTTKGWSKWITNNYNCMGADILRVEDLENSENLLNFLTDLITIMEKYNIRGSGVNGMWSNFRTNDVEKENALRVGVANLFYFFLTQEEMDQKLEEAREYAHQDMLDHRVEFVNLNPVKEEPSDEDYLDACFDDDYKSDEEKEINYNIAITELTVTINTIAKVKNLDTFDNLQAKRTTIAESLIKALDRMYYIGAGETKIKDKDALINNIEITLKGEDKSGFELYDVVIKDVILVHTYDYKTWTPDTFNKINKSINDFIEYVRDNCDIILICTSELKPINYKYEIDLNDSESRKEELYADSVEDNIDNDEEGYETEVEDWGEEDNTDDMCYYDTSGAFTADVELNVGKIETNDSDEDLIQKCIDLVIGKIESDDLYVETDVEEMDENATIEVLEDGTTLVKINNVEFSVGINIMAYNLDNANDDRWDEFYGKINSLEYLQNIRDEYVSEAD